MLKYGVRRRTFQEPETGRFGRVALLVLVVAAAVSFTLFRLSRRTPAAPEPSAAAPEAARAAANTNTPPSAASASADRARHMQRAAQWKKRTDGRTFANNTERVLLAKLIQSEADGNDPLSADTIEKLRRLPSVADLDDFLTRRLGEINFTALMSDGPTIWTRDVKVRHRGITVRRIAGEHGTTEEAVRAINRLSGSGTVKPGTVLRVPHFQKALLVVRKSSRIADLSLNGRFFKRYYGSVPADAPAGTYSVTAVDGPRDIFTRLGIRFVDSDVRELALFLAPGATLTLAER